MAEITSTSTSTSPDVTDAPVTTAAPARRGSWTSFTRWRRTRPFWGVVALIAGGWFVMRPVVGATSMLLSLGIGGVSAYVIGLGMIAAALTALFVPTQRYFPAIMAILLSLASLPLANLGGWIIGMLLGIVGGGLIFAWTPYSEAELARFAAKDARRAARPQSANAAKGRVA